MTKKELLEKAIRDYPIGTVFMNPINKHRHCEHTVLKCDIKFPNNDLKTLNINASNGFFGRACIYDNGKWAKIIKSSKPQIINNYEIF